MTDRIAALRHAIQSTLNAIAESREKVEQIAHSTMDEVQRLEVEHETVRSECDEAIAKVDELERHALAARERLVMVNRDLGTYAENDMKAAYETAQRLQIELGQWRERESQLRLRRDDIARRLKALRITAQRAEVLMVKLNQTAEYLSTEFDDVSAVLEAAQIQSVLGLQMLQLQEEERRWLVAQLHDGPMQSLASLGMRMQSASPDSMQEVRGRLNGVIGDLRHIVFDLRPPLLDDLGLVPTLKRYAHQWSERTRIHSKVELIGLETYLAPTEKVTVFRCVQEALKNVAMHSGANAVEIRLVYGVADLRVYVSDNGVGIREVTWLEWLEQGKLGMTLCRQRMNALHGSMDIDGNQPHGTIVILTMPIQRRSG